MFSDRRIRCIGQAELLKATRRLTRLFIDRDKREKTIQQDLLNHFLIDGNGLGLAQQLRATADKGDDMLLRRARAQEQFLRDATMLSKRIPFSR